MRRLGLLPGLVVNDQKLGKLESTLVVVAEELGRELVTDAGLESGAICELLLLPLLEY